MSSGSEWLPMLKQEVDPQEAHGSRFQPWLGLDGVADR